MEHLVEKARATRLRPFQTEIAFQSRRTPQRPLLLTLLTRKETPSPTLYPVEPTLLQFNINASSSVVTFNSAPDYETPTDANEDGIYEVTITASDGTNNTFLTVVVTVLDVKQTIVGVLIDGYLAVQLFFKILITTAPMILESPTPHQML